MPFNWNGDYIPSKADKTTDILGSKEIGGIGHLYTTHSDLQVMISAMMEKITVPIPYVRRGKNQHFLMMIL